MNKYLSIILLFIFLTPLVFCNELDDLWMQITESSDSWTTVENLVAIGKLGKGNQRIIANVNNYLIGMNNLFISGAGVDYSIVSACITAIMELGDISSYPVLFSVLRAGYPEVIAFEAYGALDFIDGDLMKFLYGIIENEPPEEKYTALKAGVNSRRLTVSERGQLAELALEHGFADDEDSAALSAIRYSAIPALASLRWTRANALVLRHFYRVQTDYLQGVVSKDRFIEAITCLGAVGNSEAALALGLQLGLINARTENTGFFDAEITLAIVQALGSIGDNGAFDHLLYASNLNYNEYIIYAARDAITRLKW